MASITLLEQALSSKRGERRAKRLITLLLKQRQRLSAGCTAPMIPTEYQRQQRLIAACDAAIDTVKILYRRYHGQVITGANDVE